MASDALLEAVSGYAIAEQLADIRAEILQLRADMDAHFEAVDDVLSNHTSRLAALKSA